MCRKTMIVFLHISTVLAKFISSMENSLSRSFHVHLIPPPSIGCTFHRHWPPRRSWSSCAKWRATWRPSAWGFTIRIVHDCYGEDLMGYIYINTILISIYKYNHSTLYYSIRFVWKWWHTQNVNLWWGNWWFTIGFGERNLINYIFIYIYISFSWDAIWLKMYQYLIWINWMRHDSNGGLTTANGVHVPFRMDSHAKNHQGSCG